MLTRVAPTSPACLHTVPSPALMVLIVVSVSKPQEGCFRVSRGRSGAHAISERLQQFPCVQ
eukprot:14217645-Alexandrium_andersonii.AAC.1